MKKILLLTILMFQGLFFTYAQAEVTPEEIQAAQDDAAKVQARDQELTQSIEALTRRNQQLLTIGKPDPAMVQQNVMNLLDKVFEKQKAKAEMLNKWAKAYGLDKAFSLQKKLQGQAHGKDDQAPGKNQDKDKEKDKKEKDDEKSKGKPEGAGKP